MAKGESGRIVIEIDTDLKRQLYSALALDGQTLKDWFIESATRYTNCRATSNMPATIDLEEPEKQKP